MGFFILITPSEKFLKNRFHLLIFETYFYYSRRFISAVFIHAKFKFFKKPVRLKLTVYGTIYPPSIAKTAPVINDAASEQSQAIALPTS
jgi:hypothetical protein